MTLLSTLTSFLLCASPSAPPAVECEALAASFCSRLYSPAQRGNLDLPSGDGALRVRKGLSENDLSPSLVRSLELRVKHAAKLRPALRQELERLQFFAKARRLLAAPAVGKATVAQVLANRELGHDVQDAWSHAVDAAVDRSVEERHPGALRILARDWDPAWHSEARAYRNELRRDAHRAMWNGSPEWTRAQTAFSAIRGILREWIEARRAGLPEKLGASILEDLDALRMVEPGTSGIPNEGCATTIENAKYLPTNDLIEVCAGLLISPSLPIVLAHEMGHILGPSRQRMRVLESWELTSLWTALHEDACTGKPISCETWADLKARSGKALEAFPLPPLEPREVLTCLQDRTLKHLEPSVLGYESERGATQITQGLASQGSFLRLTRETATTWAGQKFSNPSHFATCGDGVRADWDELQPIDADKISVTAFLAEYQCASEPSSPERLSGAIERARSLERSFLEKLFAFGGAFSSVQWLNDNGYAQSVDEHLADLVAREVFAKYLARFPSVEERRNRFLAAAAEYCDPPSWATEFPQESAVQARFSARRHPTSAQRRASLFRTSMREVLACSQEPPRKECAWPPAAVPAQATESP